jgi:hypothetical protein
MASGAGQRRRRLAFEERDDAAAPDDRYGTTVGSWRWRFTRWARLQYLRGGEGVVEQRLTGRQPVVVYLLKSIEARSITPDWRAIDYATGEIFAIRSVEPSEDNSEIQLLAETGAGVNSG